MDFFKSFAFWIAILFIFAALSPFMINFWGMELSMKMQDWASFGTYFSGVLTPIAGLAIFWQLWSQHQQVQTFKNDKVKDHYVNELKSNVDELNYMISSYDNRYHSDDVLTLRLLTDGHLNPCDWHAVIFDHRYKENFPFEQEYVLGKICKKLVQIKMLAIKIDEKTTYEKLHNDFSALVFVLSANNLLENRFTFLDED